MTNKNLLEMTTLDGRPTQLPTDAVAAFEARLRGDLVRPVDPTFESARRVWNGMVDRRPGLIARCRGTADVVEAVRFADAHGLLTAVRGGGHNVAGNAVCDGGLVIDLSEMRAVQVDAPRKRVRAQGGATWGDFDAETQAYGMATPGGLISDTGVAGLTLGGGLGWLTPSYGLACDNLVSVDLVTASGEVVTASADEHAELFWGLRGGGGNFGVATSFEFALHEVGPMLYGGMALYPMDEAASVLAGAAEYREQAAREVGMLTAFTATPDGVPVLAVVAVYNGAVTTGETALAPLKRLGTPVADTFGALPYRQMQTLFDAGAPAGLRYYWKSSFLEGLPGAAIDEVVARVAERPSLQSKVFVEFLGGAFAEVPREATVFDHRDARFNLLIIGAWDESAHDAENRAWVRATWEAMQPYASDRVYVNYLGTLADEGSNRIADAYGPGKFERLVAIKRAYDPNNLFRLNQNIPP